MYLFDVHNIISAIYARFFFSCSKSTLISYRKISIYFCFVLDSTAFNSQKNSVIGTNRNHIIRLHYAYIILYNIYIYQLNAYRSAFKIWPQTHHKEVISYDIITSIYIIMRARERVMWRCMRFNGTRNGR